MAQQVCEGWTSRLYGKAFQLGTPEVFAGDFSSFVPALVRTFVQSRNARPNPGGVRAPHAGESGTTRRDRGHDSVQGAGESQSNPGSNLRHYPRGHSTFWSLQPSRGPAPGPRSRGRTDRFKHMVSGGAWLRKCALPFGTRAY